MALARPHMEGMGRTFEEALDAMRADGILPNGDEGGSGTLLVGRIIHAMRC